MPPVRIPQVVHVQRKQKADMPCMQDLRRKPKIYKGQVQIMQTIEEYQHYTRQLEGEAKKWHDAYGATPNQRDTRNHNTRWQATF